MTTTNASLFSGRTSLWVWLTRCMPALSVCLLAALLVSALLTSSSGDPENGQATLSQLILSVYTILLHILATMFPVRVCWAMGDVVKKVKDASTMRPSVVPRNREQRLHTSSETEQSTFPLFVTILPAYKETMATLEETLRVLASHSQARHSYHIYLAMEEREEKSSIKASNLIATFDKYFFGMSYTIHPANIPGEAQGKSSNEAWAAKQATKDYSSGIVKRNVIFTVMDADTHLSSRYFDQVARLHMEHPENNETTIYVPPLVFDRNLQRVPLPVRTADLMWAGAGLSSMYQSSSVCIPTSVYSLPMTLVEHVGGWDTGPGAIGEDLHMYLKCFFALSGHIKVQVIYAAASQCNVSSDAPGLLGYYDGLKARYKQALRHMWGSLDTGFAIRQTFELIKRQYKASQFLESPLPSSMSSDCNASKRTGLHKSLVNQLAPSQRLQPKPIHKRNLFTLAHRMFEAHFLPIHLATILTTTSIYTLFNSNYVPTVLKLSLDFSSFSRVVSYCCMLYYYHLYEKYHRLCVELRREEMRSAGILDDLSEHDGFTNRVFQFAGLWEAALFPVGGFIFGAIPALQAVLSHVFTDRLTYVVSLKPQLALRQWRDMSRRPPPVVHSSSAAIPPLLTESFRSSYVTPFSITSYNSARKPAVDQSSHRARHRKRISQLLKSED